MQPNQEPELAGFLARFTNLIGLSTLAAVALLSVVILLILSLPGGEQTHLRPLPPAPSSLPPALQGTPAQAAAPVAEISEPGPAPWQAPDLAALPATPQADQIRYGRELVAHTAKYLGPAGSVQHSSNGMNCQNCHLDAGTKAFGNNYALVAATYPKFRARSGTKEDVVKRVNDCFERSLNGKALPANSKEMQAMVAYIEWLGKNVDPARKVPGSGLVELPLLDRAASPEKGRAVYAQKCQVCHGTQGEGLKQPGTAEYVYPPLWGKNSYNAGAGLYRVSNFARYVKANMPLGATAANPQLSDEEAWDVAAFVNAMPRPTIDLRRDWPEIAGKPFDHPFGPYADKFSEKQHKFGPYQPIMAAKAKKP